MSGGQDAPVIVSQPNVSDVARPATRPLPARLQGLADERLASERLASERLAERPDGARDAVGGAITSSKAAPSGRSRPR
jgi:hypothetical protein